MVKNLMIYTLFLVIIDFHMNVAINFIQGNPGFVIAISVIVRLICLLLLFPLVGIIIFSSFKESAHNILLISTATIVYALVPGIFYYLKSNDSSLLEIYIDLHLNFDLFLLVCLPYILASIICIILINKLKLF